MGLCAGSERESGFSGGRTEAGLGGEEGCGGI